MTTIEQLTKQDYEEAFALNEDRLVSAQALCVRIYGSDNVALENSYLKPLLTIKQALQDKIASFEERE